MQVEFASGLKDIEDIDLLNSLCIRWIKKYRDTFIVDSESLYQQLRTEFLGEKQFQTLEKPNQLHFFPLNLEKKNKHNSDNEE